MNRAVPSLDAALSLMLLGLFGSLALLLLAASFLAGFAVGKFAVWPIVRVEPPAEGRSAPTRG